MSGAVRGLVNEVDAYESRYETVDALRVQLLAGLSRAARRGDTGFDLDMQHAIPIWALHHTQANVFHRAASLYAHMLGIKPEPEPDTNLLRPGTPFGADEQAKIEGEHATPADVRRWNQVAGFWQIGGPSQAPTSAT